MVDPESVVARLARLAELLLALDRVRDAGIDAYLADADLRAATERRLQLAIQACVDVGAHLVSELNLEPAADYGSVFHSLARAGIVDAELSVRLASAAGQRRLLVHDYLAIDDRRVF